MSFVFFFTFSKTDIQEFYELTLLDDTKTIQQKTVETLQIASKWEQENSLKINASEVNWKKKTSIDFDYLNLIVDF